MSISPRALLKDPVHLVAFGFGAGLSPYAPGTAGTLLAVPLAAASWLVPLPVRIGVGLLLAGVGVWICGESARRLGAHDHSGIVFDEIAGFYLAMLIAPAGWPWLLGGFVLFRLFDILKPWPIGHADRRVSGGFGIMLDDLLAGIYAGLALRLADSFLTGAWTGAA